MGLLAGLTRARIGLLLAAITSIVLLSASPALAQTGTISGKVTAAAGGANLQNIEVDVLDTNQNVVTSVCTLSDGTYSAGGLATGNYVVQFIANGSGFSSCGPPQDYAGQYYNGKTTFASANQVSVTDGSNTPNINAALANGGHITGTVTAAAGGGHLQNIEVNAFDSNGNFAGYACTGINGTYTLTGLATDATGYVVQFAPNNGGFSPCPGPAQNYVTQFYNGKSTFGSADKVPVTAGSTVSNVNAALQAGAQIKGTVTAASGGAPLQNIEVDVLDSNNNFVASTCTAANGTYTVQGLAAATYVVQFIADNSGFGFCGAGPQNYVNQYYNNKSTFATADPVAVTAGSIHGQVNAAMATGGQIMGTVTNGLTGSLLANVDVALYDSSGNQISAPTCTAADGSYTFQGLGTGAYRVGFDQNGFCPNAPPGYQSQFYKYEPGLTSADPINVTAGSTTSGIDGALAPNGTHVLGVSRAGSGSGTVSSSPAGIACPATCVHAFTSATPVTLTATPAAGSTFSGWSGAGCSGTTTCTVTMSSDHGVTATFATTPPPPTTHTLSVSWAGSGSGSVSSSPAGISCSSPCSHAFASGSSVTLTASPASGSTFVGWSGAGCSGTGLCTVTMGSDQAVTATFATKPPPAPSCTVKPKSSKVLVKAKKGKKGSKAKVGRLDVSITCDQAAGVKLTGLLTETVTKKGKKHTKTMSIGTANGTATAGKALVLSLHVPGGALKAFKHAAKESVLFTVTAQNANGTSTQTATVTHLRSA